MNTEYKWLPCDPTQEMIDNAVEVFLNSQSDNIENINVVIKSVLKAAWKAAPTVDQEPVGEITLFDCSYIGELRNPNDDHIDGTPLYTHPVAPKWVKFDINNPTTYPPAGTHAFRYLVITTNGVQPIKIIAHWDGRNWFADQKYIEVSYWMPIP